MNRRRRALFAAALALAWAPITGAQEDISGTWAGELAVSPDTSLTIHFVLTRQDDGSYSALLTSPDQGGVQDTPANTVSFESNHLMLTVDALSGSYDGMLEGGEIVGEWRQEGAAIPLNLTPYEAPVLTQADVDYLLGSWTGKLDAFGLELTIVFRFETNDAGEFVAFLDSPDQGANDIPATNVELVDGELSLRVPRVMGEFTATVEGDSLVGTWRQGLGEGLPLTVSRGEYTPTVATLDLTNADMAALGGAWTGTLVVGDMNLELTIRIETADNGDPAGYLDVPAQGASGVPVTEATLADGQLTLRIATIGASYTATVDGDELTGQWQQGQGSLPLTLQRQ